MTHLVYIDTETTGLDLERHQIWELALIVEGHSKPERDGEYLFQFPVDLSRADPMALSISGYYKRAVHFTQHNYAAHVRVLASPVISTPESYTLRAILNDLIVLTDGAHLVGAVPDFDAYRLARLLRANQLQPTWHYHLVDVENLAVGYLAGKAAERKLEKRFVELAPEDMVYTFGESARHWATIGGAQVRYFFSPVALRGYDNFLYYHSDRDDVAEFTDIVKLARNATRVVQERQQFGYYVDAEAGSELSLPWKSDELSGRIGVTAPQGDERHTALADARWARDIYKKVLG